ncbi:MAG: ABC transporter ATP-binding protein [Actinomycetota bacterium]
MTDQASAHELRTESDLVRVENLKVYFPIRSGVVIERHVGDVKAVDGVTFQIRRGETLGLVGESGCGKTTVGRTILRLYDPTEGSIWFEDRDIASLSQKEMRSLRRRMQMVFQDPYSSLNPRQNVGGIVAEPLRIHGLKGAELDKKVAHLLDVVGLPSGAGNRYPHEFSGGQRQRIGLARSLALNPALIVADEPVSALDVSIQAQIINLLEDLQDEFDLTYLFVAHDLAVVRHISDRIAVMYLGKIVEIAPADELYTEPLHPYTKALLSAVPIPDPEVEAKRARMLIPGDLPSSSNPPSGCRFHTRCRFVQPTRCKDEVPELRRFKEGHVAACHWVEEIEAGKIQPHEPDPGPAEFSAKSSPKLTSAERAADIGSSVTIEPPR